MAFLRFSRDKRGNELFSLVQSEQRGGQSRPRVLYAFRTPANIRVGREPFDEDTRRSLEKANPGVGFNWRQITETPIPAADAIDWRERRRAMKEAKRAARQEEEPEAAAAPAAVESTPPAEPGSRRRRRRRGRRRPDVAASPGSGNPDTAAPTAETTEEPESSS